eukprot:7059963-Prymnesium_polylepis.1
MAGGIGVHTRKGVLVVSLFDRRRDVATNRASQCRSLVRGFPGVICRGRPRPWGQTATARAVPASHAPTAIAQRNLIASSSLFTTAV